MSQENIAKKLVEYGLTKTEARIYVLLAKKGSTKAKDIISYLKSSKQQVYPALKNLQNKGIVYATLEYPAKFSAIPFEKAIDLFSKAKIEEAKGIQKNKSMLLSDWQTVSMRKIEDPTAKFAVIEGRKYLYSKIQQMLQETKKQFCIAAPLANIIRTYEYGIDESLLEKQIKSKIKFRLLTELNKKNIASGKALLETVKAKGLTIRGRNPELGLPLFPQMIIKDDEEIILFIDQKAGIPNNFDGHSVLWTNCKSIIESFQGIFNEIWRNSIDLCTKIEQFQSGASIYRTEIITNPEKGQQKLEETLKAASNDVIMMLSTNALIEFSKDFFELKEWCRKDLKIKILTPITTTNLETVQNMAKTCQIRHIPESFLDTFVIDSRHLIQLKSSKSDTYKLSSRFENTFYSSDIEYIEKTKHMLQHLWRSAETTSISSTQKVHQVFKEQPTVYTYSKANSPYKKMMFRYQEEPRAVSEEQVLSKIASARKHKARNPITEQTVFYGRIASALIHSPKLFKLPDMILFVSKWNKNSSFGQASDIVIMLRLNAEKGEEFVPVAGLRDTTRGLELRKQIFVNTPAGKNIQIFGKDEFHVEAYGNILFAAWTKPIILIPSIYVIPPSCILFEGYGAIKTGLMRSYPNPERIQLWEYNGMEAFVTFFHPDSKYSGPGTDGTLSRDLILTSQPISSNLQNKIHCPLPGN